MFDIVEINSSNEQSNLPLSDSYIEGPNCTSSIEITDPLSQVMCIESLSHSMTLPSIEKKQIWFYFLITVI